MQEQGDISVEFSAYLDGQLTPDAARWVDRAAAENPDVARRLHDLRRIRTILRAIEPVSPAPDFVARVLAEARRRGLMRRVVRERMIRGAVRLASAAAAVMLVAVVAGVAVQGLRNPSGPAGAQGTPAREAAPAIAAAPTPGFDEAPRGRGRATARATGRPLHNGKVERLATIIGDGKARTLDLAVTDLGAGAKEVTAVLADAGITRFSADDWQYDSANRPGVRPPAPEPTTPPSKLGLDELTGFSPIPGESNELRFIVMAPPERIDAVARRLDNLRQKENPDDSSNDLFIAGVSRQASTLPKAVETQPAGPPAAKAKVDSPGEPYHTAELERLKNASQLQAGQNQAAPAATSQAAGSAGARNQAIIITIRLRPSDANRSDPARNLKQ
jgi:hypothetical protein